MKRRILICTGIAMLAIVAGVTIWNICFSTTHIAFVNYQVITLGQISKSNDNARIRLSLLNVDDLDHIDNYDMVLINGMGLRITEKQRTAIQQAADNGLPILTTMATNPANEIVSVDSISAARIRGYLNGGGRQNYRNMLTYIRRQINGKTFDSEEPEEPISRGLKQFYHIDPNNTDAEKLNFSSVAEYESFLNKHELLKNNAPHIIVTGQMGVPEDMVAALEKTGNTVYCLRDMRMAIQNGQADSICPSAVINMAHGRMGDYMVDYLTQRNIPLFAPLNVNTLVEEWKNDNMGMNGGFMSQSIVMPEIDGAIRPFVLFGHRFDSEGLQQAYAIPERLETFVQSVNKHISLQRKPNSEKKVAIYYYKGPGQNALTATGMEVAPSLYNLLVRMKHEGYRVENLPASAEELKELIQCQGAVFNAYANGAKSAFLKNGNPELISAADYAKWTTSTIRPEQMSEVVNLDGEFPGSYISTSDGKLALPRIKLGNIVLLPQLAAGAGDDDFAIVHGTDAAPPHAYIASYLWTRYGFGADVLIHFGTHGSLEFTPRKQVALSGKDWPDALIGSTPHLYIYSIGDVGEGMIAKRRAYATLQSHLTPPFMESSVRGIYKDLCTAIQQYNDLIYADNKPDTKKAALKIKRLTVELGIHRELRLDSLLATPYTEQEIARIEAFAEELSNEKITGELYTMGIPYSKERIRSSVYAMSTEPIAYSLLALDKLRGKTIQDAEKHKSIFTHRYLIPASELVTQLLNDSTQCSDAKICDVAGISAEELNLAREIEHSLNINQDMMARMMAMQASVGAHSPRKGIDGHKGNEMRHPSWIPKIGKRPKNSRLDNNNEKTGMHEEGMTTMMAVLKSYTKKEKDFALAVMEIERTIRNVGHYEKGLEQSPEVEMLSLLNAMNGGYTRPSSGGDPISNPNAVPTGRNLYAVNAEATPSETAWEHGKELAENTIKMYRDRHNDSIPRKVSYTLWSGEFVETEGATIAQILYMLGVEPIRDIFGRVSDIRLIPSEQLGRPRIDVVVQTSGQLRDIAASRLFLISRAVEMAAAAKGDKYENYVAQSVVDAERKLIDKGLSPKEAREVSTYRVFGGVNGNYGTGITDMVQSGDRWNNSAEIANVYLQNMSAFYGSEKSWEQVQQFALEAALTNTDAVIQPRQSNTWGALSLDHVYEFMGGMNLAIRNVTGKEPDAYMSDYRNRNNMRMQELKEAIGIESRTTIFNPTYIREKMKSGASAASGFAEIVQNTYGWNVMKPEAIDNELWDEIYEVYVKDKFQLGVHNYFTAQNPAALEEITAVMTETARKGMWNASAEQLKTIAELHTELVNKYKPSCSEFVCNNAKLQDFIASKATPEVSDEYRQNIQELRENPESVDKCMILKRNETNSTDNVTTLVSNTLVGIIVLAVIVVLVLVIRHRRKKMEE